MNDVSVEVALHIHPEHGEGPMWDEAMSRLWWVDIAGRCVHCFDPASSINQSWPVNFEPGGIVIDRTGTPIIASPAGLAYLDILTGSTKLFLPIEKDKVENRANDIKVDRRGRIWVGTMSYDKKPKHAGLYRVENDLVTCVVEELTISNGPAFNDVAGRLYLADTSEGIIDVFDFNLDSGVIRNRRRFLDFREKGWWPDGMTVDDEGMLWVALGRSGAVHRYSSDGKLQMVVAIPTSNPTSITFGGADRGDMYITTSWTDLEINQRSQQPLAGAVFRCRPGVSGPTSPRYKEKKDESYNSQTK